VVSPLSITTGFPYRNLLRGLFERCALARVLIDSTVLFRVGGVPDKTILPRRNRIHFGFARNFWGVQFSRMPPECVAPTSPPDGS